MTARLLRLCFERWRGWASMEALCSSGLIEAFGFVKIEFPRTAPMTLDTVCECTDEDAAAAPDACWPDTDDGF